MADPTSTSRPTIHWQGVARPELEEGIFEELRQWGIYDGGDDLSGLVFHTYIIDPSNLDGPSVDIFWEGYKLCAVYTLKTSWVKASDALKGVTPEGN
jgi:hypothetical protein